VQRLVAVAELANQLGNCIGCIVKLAEIPNLAQSERLNIARMHYQLRGYRFRDFARRIGVDRSSAFELVKLHRHRAAILSRCLDEQARSGARGEPYSYPGWQTALGWFEGTGHPRAPRVVWQSESDEWETPPALFKFLDDIYHFRRGCMRLGSEREVPPVLQQGARRANPDVAGEAHILDERAIQPSEQMGEEGIAGCEGRCHRGRFICQSFGNWLVPRSCRTTRLDRATAWSIELHAPRQTNIGQHVVRPVRVDPGNLATLGW
jgi:hypothetical protein